MSAPETIEPSGTSPRSGDAQPRAHESSRGRRWWQRAGWAAVAVVVGLGLGVLIGRVTRPSADSPDASAPARPTSVDSSRTSVDSSPPADLESAVDSTGSAEGDAGTDDGLAAADIGDGAAAGSGRATGAGVVPANTAAGPLEPNPGGAPDVSPFPGSGFETGADGPPDSSVVAGSGDEGFADLVTLYRSAARDTLEGAPDVAEASEATTIDDRLAFADPCALRRDESCPPGTRAVVFAQTSIPLQVFGAIEVEPDSRYAAECTRQIGGTDPGATTVFAVVANQPIVGVADFVVRVAGDGTPAMYTREVAFRLSDRSLRASAAGASAWTDRVEAGYEPPTVPHCFAVERQQLRDANRGCIASAFNFSCVSGIEISWRGTAVDAGQQKLSWSHGQWAGTGRDERDSIAVGPVRIDPLDATTVEVTVPFRAFGRGEVTAGGTTSVMAATTVVAAAYPGATDCGSIDPMRLNAAPVSRQWAATRFEEVRDLGAGYVADRRAVITLSTPHPSRLAQGELLALCVWWVRFADTSTESSAVTRVEQHELVPPSASVTDLTFVDASSGIQLDELQLAFLGASPLSRGCGFVFDRATGGRNRLSDPARPELICRLRTDVLLDPPEHATLYVELPERLTPTSSAIVSRQRLIRVAQGGCRPDGCPGPRLERFEFPGGHHVTFGLVPSPTATTPQLPGGRLSTEFRDDRWVVNPSGVRRPAVAAAPDRLSQQAQVDTFGTRAVPNGARPTTAIDVSWAADRPVTVSALARPRTPGTDPSCTSGWTRSGTSLATSGAITIEGLCPGTRYAVELELVDRRAQVVTVSPSSEPPFVLGGLHTETDRAPLPADFGYRYEVRVLRAPGLEVGRSAVVLAESRIGAGAVRIGPGIVVDPGGACPRWGPAAPIAEGFGDRPQVVVGDVFVEVHVRGRAAGLTGRCDVSMLASPQEVSLRARAWARWDGATRLTIPLTSDDGSWAVEVVLIPDRD